MDHDTTTFSLAESWRRPSPRLLRLRRALGKDFASAYLFMLPTLFIMGGLIAYPFARALYISFTRTHGRTIGPFIGLDNYRALWRDRFFRESVAVTIRYTVWSVGLTFLISTAAATLVHGLGPRANFVAGLMLLPWIMPEIVRAITWRGLLNPLYGAVNRVLIDLGITQRGFPFFGSFETALASVIVVNVWQRVPFFLLNFLASLKSIDVELYDAAAIDGAGGWRQFLHITLPGLRRVIIVVVLLGTIWSFNEFSLIFLLTGGGPMNATKVYAVLAYWLARQRMGMGVAVAMSMAPVFVVAIMVLGRYIVRPEEGSAQEETPAMGVLAALGRVLSVPASALGRGIRALLWGAVAGIEWLVGRVSRLGPREDSRVALRRRRRASTVAAWLILLAVATFELAPFYSVIVTAFKSELQITLFESVLWPRPWSIQQFQRLLGPQRNFWPWLQNTLLVSLLTPALATLVAAGGAYALVRLKWRGAFLFGRLVLVSYLMPAVMIVMPIYHLFGRLGLLNTRLSLILSYPTFILPFGLWLLMGYYASIPRELDDAAMIDGCSPFQIFARVIVPLSKPALAAAFLFGISQAWSEFLFAMTFIVSESKMTLPLGLAQMIFGDVLPWGELSAAALIMALPVLAIYTTGQRYMVSGLIAGSLKG